MSKAKPYPARWVMPEPMRVGGGNQVASLNGADDKGATMTDHTMPMQPISPDGKGVMRFVKNRIVEDLLAFAAARGFGLNEIAASHHYYTDDEHMQLAQLLGYSVDGYGELSYVTDESYDAAKRCATEGGGQPRRGRIVIREPIKCDSIEGVHVEYIGPPDVKAVVVIGTPAKRPTPPV